MFKNQYKLCNNFCFQDPESNQQAFVFHLLRDFGNAYDHIEALLQVADKVLDILYIYIYIYMMNKKL